jgi:hypothetical protein
VKPRQRGVATATVRRSSARCGTLGRRSWSRSARCPSRHGAAAARPAWTDVRAPRSARPGRSRPWSAAMPPDRRPCVTTGSWRNAPRWRCRQSPARRRRSRPRVRRFPGSPIGSLSQPLDVDDRHHFSYVGRIGPPTIAVVCVEADFSDDLVGYSVAGGGAARARHPKSNFRTTGRLAMTSCVCCQVAGTGAGDVRGHLEQIPQVSVDDHVKLTDGAKQSLDSTLRHLMDHNCRILLKSHFDEGASPLADACGWPASRTSLDNHRSGEVR